MVTYGGMSRVPVVITTVSNLTYLHTWLVKQILSLPPSLFLSLSLSSLATGGLHLQGVAMYWLLELNVVGKKL